MLMYTYTYMYVYMCVCVYIYICAVIPHTALLSHSELPQGKFLHRDSPSQYFCLYSVCTSHWCLVMSFCLKVCIYSHTRGVKLGLGLGFMQTSQVLPHWLNQSFSFWTLSYTQRHCHVRIEKSPNCCYNIRSTQFPRISLYALTLRFVLIEITKVVKPVH